MFPLTRDWEEQSPRWVWKRLCFSWATLAVELTRVATDLCFEIDKFIFNNWVCFNGVISVFFNSLGGSPLQGNATVYKGGYLWLLFFFYWSKGLWISKELIHAECHKRNTNSWIYTCSFTWNECRTHSLKGSFSVRLFYICSRFDIPLISWENQKLCFVLSWGLFQTTDVVKLNAKSFCCACQLNNQQVVTPYTHGLLFQCQQASQFNAHTKTLVVVFGFLLPAVQ